MKVILALLALLLCREAAAASISCTAILNGSAPVGCAATLSNSSAQVLTALYGGSRSQIIIDNEQASGGDAIACTFDGSSAALNTAGSFTVAAATKFQISGPGTPSGVINCIGVGADKITILAQ